LRRALTSSRLRAVVPTRSPVRSAAISPDDSRVLTVDGQGIAHVRSATGGGGDLASFGAGLVNDAAFDSTGQLIVTASKDGTARIVDASRGEERLVIRAGSAPVVAARFSGNGRRVLTVSRDGVAAPSTRARANVSTSHAFRRRCRGTSSAQAARRFC
jgi:WD40 repeat protein